VGEEEGDGACTDVLRNTKGTRFGRCSADDVSDARQGMGLEPLGKLEDLAAAVVEPLVGAPKTGTTNQLVPPKNGGK
jgi:hypothetical protein